MVIGDVTMQQLAELRCDADRPLVICDVDEVVVHFTRDFEAYLDQRGLWLDTASLALDGNIRRRPLGEAIARAEVGEVVERFFADRTLHLEPIAGAVEALHEIAGESNLVFLSNLPHASGDARRENLKRFGFTQPLVTNSGPKGPAIRALARMTGNVTVFIDDSPGFIASAREHAPEVHLIHFMHDERFARHVRPFDYVSLFTGDWQTARPHILNLLGA
jgi:hypothetical protein